MSNDKTTVVVRRETRNRLAEHGNKDDTFDDIINNILDKIEDDGC